jgi:hypothetical protein
MTSKIINQVYLACPYTHPDQTVRQERFDQACKAAAWLRTEVGFSRVFSPIAHSHPIHERGGGGIEFSSWMDFDLAQLSVSGAFGRLMIDGWNTSSGLKTETEKALESGIIVFKMIPVKVGYWIDLDFNQELQPMDTQEKIAWIKARLADQ